MFRIVFLYAAAFTALTATDIGTTLWATSTGAGQEFNHSVATDDGLLHIERMLMINGAMLVFTLGMLMWAMRNRDRIDPRYLAWPERAMFKYFYINPFSATNVPHSVLHYLALPLAMLGMKAVASVNNALISLSLPDVVTPLAVEVMRHAGNGALAYWIVIVILFHPIWWVSLRIVAAMLSDRDDKYMADPLAAR
jgi:hypothetical protein